MMPTPIFGGSKAPKSRPSIKEERTTTNMTWKQIKPGSDEGILITWKSHELTEIVSFAHKRVRNSDISIL